MGGCSSVTSRSDSRQKRVAPKVPLALLLPAPLLLDLLWPLFFFGGIEHFDVDPSQRGFLVLQLIHVPWTHGLLSAVIRFLPVGVPYYLWRRDVPGSAILGALVFSHWLFDVITHTPDLPVTPWGAERLGLGLWTSPGGTLLVEGLLFVGCVAWITPWWGRWIDGLRPLREAAAEAVQPAPSRG